MRSALRTILLGSSAPTWQWDFRLGSLPAGSTFTRASAGWSFNSSGVLVSSSTNVARFDYDPVTLQPLGYLAEMQSTNAVTQSQAFTNAAWSATGLTVTDNAVTSPDGTTDAATLLETSANSAHSVIFSSWSETLSSIYGVSIFAKNITGSRWLQINIGGAFFANFQPSTGTIGSISGTNVASASARQLANGWWRFSLLFTGDATASTTMRLYLATASNASGAPSYAGDGTSTIAVYGAQVDTAGVGVTSYIPTAGSTVTRAQDALSLLLTSLPGWNASKGGVLLAIYRLHTIVPASGADNQVPITVNDGTSSNLIDVRGNYIPLQHALGLMVSGGVSQGNPNGSNPALVPFARTKLALGYSTTDMYLAANGSFADSRTGTFTLPVGLNSLGVRSLNGTLESIAYYAGARSDAFVQGVSR